MRSIGKNTPLATLILDRGHKMSQVLETKKVTNDIDNESIFRAKKSLTIYDPTVEWTSPIYVSIKKIASKDHNLATVVVPASPLAWKCDVESQYFSRAPACRRRKMTKAVHSQLLLAHRGNAGWWLTYPSEKYEFVRWGYYSQYMENRKCSKPPTS